MDADIREIVGALMRVLGGGEISRAEVEDLTFDADGDLRLALNGAYIQLLEFAFDQDERRKSEQIDREKRAELQVVLNKIVRLSDARASN